MENKFSLLELNKSIQENINTNFPENIWVIGEISEIKVNRNGHCYLELIEKDVITDNIIAKSRATIWAFTFRMLRPYFESITGRELNSGIKILVQVKIEFHELYGLSLNITDIYPNYTLVDLDQKKAEIIKQLDEEGVIDLNKELDFPIVPQKIAIISSETAAGYQDFMEQLMNNKFGFRFYTKLFPSIMQGMQAEESIINSLEKIYMYENLFDVVVIIRGGGSQADLSCFDNYLLAANIAQFPIPVLTGIGHDKDESVADIVAHKKLKTPTAVAEYLIDKFEAFEERLDNINNEIVGFFHETIENQKQKLNQLSRLLIPLVKNNLNNHNFRLNLLKARTNSNVNLFINNKYSNLIELKKQIPFYIKTIFSSNFKQLKNLKISIKTASAYLLRREKLILDKKFNTLKLLDPTNVLKRGYSITYHNGAILKNISSIKEEDEIKTKLLEGSIRSTVKMKLKK